MNAVKTLPGARAVLHDRRVDISLPEWYFQHQNNTRFAQCQYLACLLFSQNVSICARNTDVCISFKENAQTDINEGRTDQYISFLEKSPARM